MATFRLVGTTNDEGLVSNDDTVQLVKHTAEASGLITEFKVYSTANGNVKVAIYSDDNGEPGTRLTYNDTGQAVSSGQWNTLSIPELEVTSGTVYWLAAICDTDDSLARYVDAGQVRRNKSEEYDTFGWPTTLSGLSNASNGISLAGWGVLVVKPSSIIQPVSYGTPMVQVGAGGLTVIPTSIVQAIVIGIPTVIGGEPAGLVIYPQSIFQPISIGSPTILKCVWHVILDGQYNIESPEVNRAFVIGRDIYGNPVFGSAVDSAELGLVGERLDFQQELAIPTTAQAGAIAEAILSKMRLTGKRGVMLIPPNCGQELWDVVEVWDGPGNQSAVKFRVVGIHFEYNPRQAKYEHRLILGAP